MMQMLSVVDPRFILMVLLGSGGWSVRRSDPGTFRVHGDRASRIHYLYLGTFRRLAMIMGVYVVGVFSGAVSAILINIPGALHRS